MPQCSCSPEELEKVFALALADWPAFCDAHRAALRAKWREETRAARVKKQPKQKRQRRSVTSRPILKKTAEPRRPVSPRPSISPLDKQRFKAFVIPLEVRWTSFNLNLWRATDPAARGSLIVQRLRRHGVVNDFEEIILSGHARLSPRGTAWGFGGKVPTGTILWRTLDVLLNNRLPPPRAPSSEIYGPLLEEDDVLDDVPDDGVEDN